MEYKPYNIDTLLNASFQNLEIDIKDLLEERLKEYDISRTKLLSLLNIDKDIFDDIINGVAKQPSLFNVIKIAQFLELEIDEVIPSILKNQSRENINSLEKSKKALFIAKNFDVKKLCKVGFFEESDDVDYLLVRILVFFGFSSIYDYEKQLQNPLFSKTKRLSFSDRMKQFWVNSAYQCFKSINNENPYDREALKAILVKMKPYCQDVENGLHTVLKALYSVGVTVIVQNHLTLTQVRGGTFVVDSKPCIVLTDLNKKYTTIWETLIHELHHVLMDIDIIATIGYHLTGDADLLLIEDKAEQFSREYFCGFNDYKKIKPYIHNKFMVERFAKDLEIDKSFVYSSYRQFEQIYHKKNYYSLFHEHFPDHAIALKRLSPVTWKENSISEIAKELKKTFELTNIL